VNSSLHRYGFAVLAATLVAGCSAPHGQPRSGAETLAPDDVLDFRVLYAENCSACHGQNGNGGPAIGLADPVYLAIADNTALRRAIADGVRGTTMPAFAASAGGMLTDRQIDVLVREIRSRWSRPGILDGANPPAYAAKSAGDAERGKTVYRTYCESCHGPDGRGGAKGSAIADDSFLALVSDQGLRTIVIVGRPELKAPDWRGNVAGKPMSDQEITDVVAWLASRRAGTPGQPYSTSNYGRR
jgi:cytochrome c oxidase cbb3-type subunit III